jgi:hypothetical protein
MVRRVQAENKLMIDENLKQWATPKQAEYIDAILKHGNHRSAAQALGIHRRTMERGLESLKKKAAFAGYSPDHAMTKTVPDGYIVKGVSTYYDKDGKPAGQWVKSSVDHARVNELMRAAVEALSEEVRDFSPIIPPPPHALKDILAVYPFGDPHVGLHVWAKECGEAFDLEIGRKLTLGAVDRLVSSTPAAETAVLLLLGDVFHMNDQTNQTPAHKNQLDVDSRFVKVLQVGIETYRHAALRMLEKHQKVIIKAIPGNHDPQAIWALTFTLAAYFANEPRVEVDTGPSKFWFYRFGKVLLGSTHGDTVKPEQLGAIMACDRAEEWGQTKYRYFYTGHIHSSNKKEFPGMVWESFRTLAAQDSYAAGHGYRAGRDMLAIVHHKEFGEIERHRCDVAMVE